MQQNGKHIAGELTQVNNLTKGWFELNISPIELDVNLDEIVQIANDSKGLFADLSDDVEACIRFQYKEDAERFEMIYHSQLPVS